MKVKFIVVLFLFFTISNAQKTVFELIDPDSSGIHFNNYIEDKKENYPRVMVTTPKKLALRIFNAQQSNKDVIYSSISWQLIMFFIKLIPEALFKKLKI